MPTLPFNNISPKIPKSVFLAPTAWVTGDVEIGENSSIFFGAVIRGDILPVRVGNRTNIQESALLHTSHDRNPCIVGDDVTIGHAAIVHGCRVGNRCIIGMNAVILDDVVIEDDCIIGANSLVTSGAVISSGSLAFGNPAKVVRKLAPEEIKSILESAVSYVSVSRRYSIEREL